MPKVESFWEEKIRGKTYLVGESGRILVYHPDDPRISRAIEVGQKENVGIQAGLEQWAKE
jgi:hypothetical protein